VAEKVLRKARCPVLVVREAGHEAVGVEGAQNSVELRRLIFCTDFSDPSRGALDKEGGIWCRQPLKLSV
jgi:hypothetical protein